MKEIRIMFEDAEYEDALKQKKDRTWKQVMTDGLKNELERP